MQVTPTPKAMELMVIKLIFKYTKPSYLWRYTKNEKGTWDEGAFFIVVIAGEGLM